MICVHCKTELPDYALFCGHCGMLVEVIQEDETTASSTVENPHGFATPNLSPPRDPRPPLAPKPIYEYDISGNLQAEDEFDGEVSTSEAYSTATVVTVKEPMLNTNSTPKPKEESLTGPQYFFLLLVGFIPLLGLCFLTVLAVSPEVSQKRSFARGALFFFPVAIALAYVFCKAFLGGLF